MTNEEFYKSMGTEVFARMLLATFVDESTYWQLQKNPYKAILRHLKSNYLEPDDDEVAE